MSDTPDQPATKENEQARNAFSVAEVLIHEDKYLQALIDKNTDVIKEALEGEPLYQTLPPSLSKPDADPRDVIDALKVYRTDRAKLQRDALCLSGGGIRSACISLGVMQGLAGRKLLTRFHYLSTVSGGGYIGCWLSTWIDALRSPGTIGDAVAVEKLLPHADKGVERREIRNLRTNSNFLTPRVGALSVDLFACIMIIVRNMLVNWLILIPCFALGLAVTMLVLKTGSHLIDFPNIPAVGSLSARIPLLGGAALSFGLLAVVCLGINGAIAVKVMPIYIRARKKNGEFGEMSGDYKAWMGARWFLTLVAAFLMAIWTHTITTPQADRFVLLSSTNQWLPYWPIYALILLPYLLGLRRAFTNNDDAAVERNDPRFYFQLIFSFALASALSYVVARGLMASICPSAPAILHFFHPILSHFRHTLYMTFVPALWILVLEFQNFLMLGCVSMVTNDEDREWWSRSNGVMVLLALGWLAACLITTCGPALYFLFIAHKTELLAALGSQFTLGGVLALMASSAKTPATAQDRPAPTRMILLQAGAIVFFILLAMLLATANYKLTASMKGGPDTPFAGDSVPGPKVAPKSEAAPASPAAPVAHANELQASVPPVATPSSLSQDSSTQEKDKPAPAQTVNRPMPARGMAPELAPLIFWVGIVVLWLVITACASWVININQFSLQCLYRNRLLRCFIGAVRRVPVAGTKLQHEFEPFTGFDTTDNYEVSNLRYQLPFHVINMAQNLIRTTNLAWQQRMACSFTTTPLYTGGEITGYRTTRNFGNGISIGTAMATSGAAANPSMGHATSPILELLMSLFNARLGWWVGNPNSEKKWRDVGPRLALQPLLQEMFGQTSEGQDYVLLSDGGHFEDLGIYEMVQRRCRFLVVVDGGADPTGNFEDLGNAIRKVRIDLGVEIDFLFNRTSPKLAEKMDERQHFAVAKIVYSKTDDTPQEQDGWLLYIKGHLNGDESQDIYQYKQFYDDFPHQSTVDQWFDESQFESYRALGQHSLERTLDALNNYRQRTFRFFKDPAPGAITDEELGGRKVEFLKFLQFLKDRNFR
jgi:hypothetical protein